MQVDRDSPCNELGVTWIELVIDFTCATFIYPSPNGNLPEQDLFKMQDFFAAACKRIFTLCNTSLDKHVKYFRNVFRPWQQLSFQMLWASLLDRDSSARSMFPQICCTWSGTMVQIATAPSLEMPPSSYRHGLCGHPSLQVCTGESDASLLHPLSVLLLLGH